MHPNSHMAKLLRETGGNPRTLAEMDLFGVQPWRFLVKTDSGWRRIREIARYVTVGVYVTFYYPEPHEERMMTRFPENTPVMQHGGIANEP